VDHQVQELPDLGLELVAFGGLAHGLYYRAADSDDLGRVTCNSE
jgi:hypothetical protein